MKRRSQGNTDSLFLSAPEEGAAVGAVRHFYDKLIKLPLEEKAPELFNHYLITFSTVERVNSSCYIRVERAGSSYRMSLRQYSRNQKCWMSSANSCKIGK